MSFEDVPLRLMHVARDCAAALSTLCDIFSARRACLPLQRQRYLHSKCQITFRRQFR